MAQDLRIMFPVDEELKTLIEKTAAARNMSTSAFIKATMAKECGTIYDPSTTTPTRNTEPCPHGNVKSKCNACSKAYQKSRRDNIKTVWEAYQEQVKKQKEEADNS